MPKFWNRTGNRIKWIVILGISIFLLARLYYNVTDDFRLGNITFPLPYEKNWEVASLSTEQEKSLESILAQPFYYLGKGAQSYVFASEDGKYVLKFFKFKHLRPSFFIDSLPPIGFLKSYKEKQAARKERKLFGVFNSYKLAYEMDKIESGLIFIQLNTESNLVRYATVVDKIGIKRTIDLQNYPFILQYKGETLRTVVDKYLKEGDLQTAKTRLAQILDLYTQEYAKGIYDHDHGVMQNTGFIDTTPIHLDVGKLLKEEKMQNKSYARDDLELVVRNINSWVKKNYPQYSTSIEEYLNHKLTQLFNVKTGNNTL